MDAPVWLLSAFVRQERRATGQRHMKSQRLSKAIQSLAAAVLALTGGCATVFVRSENTVQSQRVFPTTAFDAQFLWHSGFKGEPWFAATDPSERNGPAARMAYTLGAVVDFPFSVVFDTILVPVDLIRSGAPAENRDKGEPGGAAAGSQRSRSEADRVLLAAGSPIKPPPAPARRTSATERGRRARTASPLAGRL